MAVAIRCRNPGEVQQVGGSQRRDQLLDRGALIEVEAVPSDAVRGHAVATAAHRMNAKAGSKECLRTMLPQESRAARGEHCCGLRGIGHVQKVRVSDATVMR